MTVHQPSNTSRLNHAVLLVGYETNINCSYWIIQNSWGKDWGDNGFIKIRSKEGSGILSCQIYGVYPINKEVEDNVNKEDDVNKDRVMAMLELSDDEEDDDDNDMEVTDFLPDMEQFQKMISTVNNDEK